jgi:hypothetical protein
MNSILARWGGAERSARPIRPDDRGPTADSGVGWNHDLSMGDVVAPVIRRRPMNHSTIPISLGCIQMPRRRPPQRTIPTSRFKLWSAAVSTIPRITTSFSQWKGRDCSSCAGSSCSSAGLVPSMDPRTSGTVERSDIQLETWMLRASGISTTWPGSSLRQGQPGCSKGMSSRRSVSSEKRCRSGGRSAFEMARRLVWRGWGTWRLPTASRNGPAGYWVRQTHHSKERTRHSTQAHGGSHETTSHTDL